MLHHQLPEFTQTHVHRVGDAVQPSHSLSFPSLPALSIPNIRVFSNKSALHIMWLKYWSFSFSINPSNEYSGLIWSPCSPRDSQESSPTPQFKRINSLVLSFLYSPILTSIHDYWKTVALSILTLSAKWCLCFLIGYLGWIPYGKKYWWKWKRREKKLA